MASPLKLGVFRVGIPFPPLALIACGLYAMGVWIILQPMKMGGTLLLALAG